MPELSSYEAFCFDEACAHLLIKLRDKARRDAEEEARGNQEPVSKGPVSLDWLKNQQNQFQRSGRYRL